MAKEFFTFNFKVNSPLSKYSTNCVMNAVKPAHISVFKSVHQCLALQVLLSPRGNSEYMSDLNPKIPDTFNNRDKT